MTESISLTVSGMKCGGCETNVKTRLTSIEGVISVNAMSKENTVDIEFDELKTSVEVISKAISEVGYKVE